MASTTMTRADVCRLLGRVAFGATAVDIDTWTGKPYADLVDRLLLVPAAPVGADDATRPAPTTSAVQLGLPYGPVDSSRVWWLERMRSAPAPLVERMTLFWHGHFATAVRYPMTPTEAQVMNQLQTLRTLALGSFRTMAEAMTIDAAMLFWLNGNENHVPHPNENYARELFELFTLGKRPQTYTEKDIREAARALTGWLVAPDSELVPMFDPTRHDTGTKHILGTTVTDSGAQEFTKVVEAALAQPVAPYFLAYKLVREFAYVPTSRNLMKVKDPLVSAVAATLRSSDWDISKAMRTLMMADEFRHGSAPKGQQRVRQPVEVAVAACKALGVRADSPVFLEPLQRMGQVLLAPPNVGGWPAGTGWLSPVTTLGRYDLALAARNAYTLVPSTSSTLPKVDDLDGWAKMFGLPGFSSSTAAAIKGYLASRRKDPEDVRKDGVIALILSSPEWVVM
jgi:uncharacterized protein (DUF1800 family)